MNGRPAIGVVYPQTELNGDPKAVLELGKAVEDLGFDHLFAYDHVLGAVHADRTPPLTGPYTEHDPFHDPFVMFAYLAGITERIGFTTGVLILPQRQTALVARQAADVDLLSGAGCASVSVSAGARWSTTRSARTSTRAVRARKSRYRCSARCSPSPLSTTPVASIALTERRSCRSPRDPYRSGWEVRAKLHTNVPPVLLTASSSSVQLLTMPSTRGRAFANA